MLDPKAVSVHIPVYIEVDPKSLIVLGDEDASKVLSTNHFYEPLLEKGLKAQLDIESFVTRKLYINMDFHPGPPKLLGLDPRYPEIPTIPSLQEEIVKTLQKLPEKIIAVADGIERLVNSPAAQDSLRDLAVLIPSVTKEVGPLSASTRSTLEAARRALTQGEKMLAMKEGPSAEMAASFTETMKKASVSLDQMYSTLETYQRLAEPNGALGHELTRMLGDLDSAARSVHSLAEYLELHPEAILKGKQ